MSTSILARNRSDVPCSNGVQYITALALLGQRWQRDSLLTTRAQDAQSHCDALHHLLHSFGNSYPTTLMPLTRCDKCGGYHTDVRHIGQLTLCLDCTIKVITRWKDQANG